MPTDDPAPGQEPGRTWATWLQRQLDRRQWRPIDLVRAGGTKANGRPVIGSERLTNWLRASQRPSYDFAILTADALGVSPEDALLAAGYSTVPETIDKRAEQRPRDLTGYSTADLVAELYRRFVRPTARARSTDLRISAFDGRGWSDLTPDEQDQVRRAITEADTTRDGHHPTG